MMPGRRTGRPLPDVAGVALIEALVAIALLASALIALAGLLATAATATHRAHVVSTTAILASRKMEQLRSLAWSVDGTGAATSDVRTDTTAVDASTTCRAVGASVGTGLSVSPAGALDADTAGYVDYVDGLGCGLGGGDDPTVRYGVCQAMVSDGTAGFPRHGRRAAGRRGQVRPFYSGRPFTTGPAR